MNQSRRLIVKDSHRTTAEKVSVPILPQVLHILSKSEKSVYRHTEGAGRAPGEKCTDEPATTLQLERDNIAEFLISMVCLF